MGGEEHVITWEVVGLIATVVGGALGLWFIIEQRISDVREEFSRFKDKVLQEYASVQHLEKVEDRLITALTDLTQEVKELARILYRGKEDGPR